MTPNAASDRAHNNNNQHVGGKASRARAARNGLDVVTDLTKHRPSGGAPILIAGDSLDQHHYSIVTKLEELETGARIRCRPHLGTRRDVPMDNHGSMVSIGSVEASSTPDEAPVGVCDLSEQNLREFSIQLHIPTRTIDGGNPHLLELTHLDLSRNELWDLPSLESIPNVEHLNLSRNWFAELPRSLADLTKLRSLDVSHNMLRSSQAALLMDPQSNTATNTTGGTTSILRSLRHLRVLDLTFNQKCGHQKLQEKLRAELPLVQLKMTINFPRPEGAFVGDSAADRDPTLLRSQLEPWSTTALRRRLVADFGQDPASCAPQNVARGEVMDRLLRLYAEEEEQGSATSSRTMVRANGILVEETHLLDRLLVALKSWKNSWTNKNLERTSIRAENYMILTSEASWEPLGRKKRYKAEAKMNAHRAIWDLAVAVLATVDKEFSKRFSALAVTHNFKGSPHIDRQNTGPFYGLALGDFEDGTGGVMVECSARVIAHVNTKNRLGKVDGRFPHWVAPYDETKDRFSLIFYSTMGEYQKIGPAIFDSSCLL